MKLEYIATSNDNDRIIKDILLSYFQISHRLLITLKKNNCIFLNNTPSFVYQKLKEGDKLVVSFDYDEDNSNIIPKDFDILLECSFDDLYNMIDRASLLTSDREKNTIKLSLNCKELMISSNSPEIGKVEEKITVDSDKKIDISFSSKFMLDAIKSFNKEKIVLCMNNDSSPIVIKSNEVDSLLQLVLPIKTS